jgi:hypothetical protein
MNIGIKMLDKKSGKLYNPKEEFNKIFNSEWFVEQMKRMQNETVHEELNRK